MEIIKNKNELAITDKRARALGILEAGIRSVNPKILVKNSVKYNRHINSVVINNHTFDLISGRIFVVGGGKAAGAMAEALEEIFGPGNISAGVVNADSKKYKVKKIKIIKASHPIPDKNSAKGVEAMLALKEKYNPGKKDLVVCLISGGASAMMPYPADGISFRDKQEISRLLLESGADIREINTVKKHLSKIKGGQLAGHFFPAQVASIIISDVVGDKLDVVASGPTVADPSTYRDAWAVLEKYNLTKEAPRSVIRYIKSGTEGKKAETVKEVKNTVNFMIGNNTVALEEMARQAKSLCLLPLIVSSEIYGDPAIAANLIAEEIIRGRYFKYDCIFFGAETPVSPRKNRGTGGRNQHFAALTMLALEGLKTDWVMAAMATDGRDYIKNAAGAIIDKNSLSAARAKELDVAAHIKNLDTYAFFLGLGNSLIITERTGTNVGDVIMYILK